jgi:hypothetical protein
LTNRRNSILKKLEDEAALAANPDYVRVQHRRTGKGDARRRVEKQTSVKPWWREDHSGRAYMTIRVGQTPLEFEEGRLWPVQRPLKRDAGGGRLNSTRPPGRAWRQRPAP